MEKIIVTGDQIIAIRQMLDYCKSEEGKSQQGYYSSGWAGDQVQQFLSQNEPKKHVLFVE